jgi:electron transport complex protein RnfG
MSLTRHMLRSALLLGAFAVAGTAMVAFTFFGTKDEIAAQERAYMLRSLHAVIKPELHDNDIFADTLEVSAPELLGSGTSSVFRARMGGQPVAAAILCTAPDGYAGPIKLLVGILENGDITGVRVLAHKETPGLGDYIDERRDPWIHIFDGRSLTDPEPKFWKVRRDGGRFDQHTGATVTPRAIVKAVANALKFFAENKERLFAS